MHRSFVFSAFVLPPLNATYLGLVVLKKKGEKKKDDGEEKKPRSWKMQKRKLTRKKRKRQVEPARSVKQWKMQVLGDWLRRRVIPGTGSRQSINKRGDPSGPAEGRDAGPPCVTGERPSRPQQGAPLFVTRSSHAFGQALARCGHATPRPWKHDPNDRWLGSPGELPATDCVPLPLADA